MLKRLIFVLALCLSAASALTSCTSGTQNTNQNQGQNQNQNRSQGLEEDQDAASTNPPTDESICKITNIGDRIVELRKKLKSKIQGPKGKLWDQLNGVEINGKQYPPSFAFEFYPYPETGNPKYVYLLIAGTVHEKKPFEDLAEYAEDFVQKGCADQVFFVGRLPRAGEALDVSMLDIFEWSGCEYPLQLCTDGECRNPCVKHFGSKVQSTLNSSENANTKSDSAANTNTSASNGTNK